MDLLPAVERLFHQRGMKLPVRHHTADSVEVFTETNMFIAFLLQILLQFLTFDDTLLLLRTEFDYI